MALRKTKDQVVEMLAKKINADFGGNKAKAAKAWGEHRTTVTSVISGSLNPTAKMLAVLEMKKDSTIFYVRTG